jgi:G:T-mismatch repair DNA endonuclease (very short patch repair protein)
MKTNKKIIILSPLKDTMAGGPARYAKKLGDYFLRKGYKVTTLIFSKYNKLPTIIRHGVFLAAVLFNTGRARTIIALDTFSVALPGKIVSILTRKNFIVRIGGDFLYESYIERTNEPITLNEFYTNKPSFNFKERIIYSVQRLILHNSIVVWNSEFIKDIWHKAYQPKVKGEYIVINAYPEKQSGKRAIGNVFLANSRQHKIKNIDRLNKVWREAGEQVHKFYLETNEVSHQEYQNKLQSAYAVVVPSYSDISPNTILEALAIGVPCILTKENGLPQEIKELCCLIDPIDNASIWRAIISFFDVNTYQHYVDLAKKYLPKQTWEELCENYYTIAQKYENN